jgi:hypothetical protein
MTVALKAPGGQSGLSDTRRWPVFKCGGRKSHAEQGYVSVSGRPYEAMSVLSMLG